MDILHVTLCFKETQHTSCFKETQHVTFFFLRPLSNTFLMGAFKWTVITCYSICPLVGGSAANLLNPLALITQPNPYWLSIDIFCKGERVKIVQHNPYSGCNTKDRIIIFILPFIFPKTVTLVKSIYVHLITWWCIQCY